MRLHLICIFGGDHADPKILEHFIRHYRDTVGVTDWHVHVHRNMGFARVLDNHGIQYGTMTEFNELAKYNLFNSTIDAIGPEWTLTCDQDEFHDYGGRFFDKLPNDPELDCVYGLLTDRFALDGFPKLTDEPLAKQFPLRCNFTGPVLGAAYHKLLAVKGVHIKSGHHCGYGKKGWGFIPINHYKWDGSVIARFNVPRGNVASETEAGIFRTLVETGKIKDAVYGSLVPDNGEGWAPPDKTEEHG